MRSVLLAILIIATGIPRPGSAQHPVDVEQLTADHHFYEALLTYQRLPKRRATTDSVIAAAKSAWGLSLLKRAQEEYSTALKDPALKPTERARIHLAKGIISFQDDQYQEAILNADKAGELLPTPSPLRAKVWFLRGESLMRLNSYAPAEAEYQKALAEGSASDMPDLHLALGLVQIKLGKTNAAREHLQQIPLDSSRTPEALRALATLALETKDYGQAKVWLTRARKDYPDQFIDSWVDYALVKVAVSEGDLGAVEGVRAQAESKFPPSDGWLMLLQAQAESFQWLRNQGEVVHAVN